jgi:hypothetical protein
VSHVPPRCGYCAHRNYSLGCDEYEQLVADHDGRCAICRITGPETPQGFLVIDHDYWYGYWAVRGLLCSQCNTTLDAYGHTRTVAEEAYLADPWWRRHFARLGLPAEPLTEPAVGAVIAVGQFRWMRTERGWERPRAPHRLTTWRELHRQYGPHKIRM